MSFGKHFEGDVARFWDSTLRKKEKEKKELLYLSEVAAGDCMIAALKWPSGQVFGIYVGHRERNARRRLSPSSSAGSSFVSGLGIGRFVRRTAS